MVWQLLRLLVENSLLFSIPGVWWLNRLHNKRWVYTLLIEFQASLHVSFTISLQPQVSTNTHSKIISTLYQGNKGKLLNPNFHNLLYQQDGTERAQQSVDKIEIIKCKRSTWRNANRNISIKPATTFLTCFFKILTRMMSCSLASGRWQVTFNKAVICLSFSLLEYLWPSTILHTWT